MYVHSHKSMETIFMTAGSLVLLFLAFLDFSLCFEACEITDGQLVIIREKNSFNKQPCKSLPHSPNHIFSSTTPFLSTSYFMCSFCYSTLASWRACVCVCAACVCVCVRCGCVAVKALFLKGGGQSLFAKVRLTENIMGKKFTSLQ